MRQIGTIDDEVRARRLADHLQTLGITTRLDARDGAWAVWVHDENRVGPARAELEAFLRDPDATKYRNVAAAAEAARRQLDRQNREHERQSVDLRNRWLHPSPRRIPVTLAMIAASVLTYLLVDLAPFLGSRIENSLFITASPVELPEERGGRWEPGLWREHLAGLDEIRRGEVWRLVTPIFMHSRTLILHLLFNMFWLADLGSQIERARGSLRFAALVVATAVVSNLAQYLLAGPWFLGMSGVVYGLLGYIWMKVRYDPDTAMRLRANTVPTMLIWLLLCTTGLLGPIANAAHIAGLLAGMAIGVAAHARDALRLW